MQAPGGENRRCGVAGGSGRSLIRLADCGGNDEDQQPSVRLALGVVRREKDHLSNVVDYRNSVRPAPGGQVDGV